MKNILNSKIYGDPLFLDAMSGEFTAHTDPDTVHTLGRLIVDIFNKGEQVATSAEDETLVGSAGIIHTVSHQPEWAAGVEARTIFRSNRHSPVFQEIAGVALTGPNISLSVALLNKDASNKIALYANEASRSLELILENSTSSIIEVRSVVTTQVSDFFNIGELK
jgi:hypothetical protein